MFGLETGNFSGRDIFVSRSVKTMSLSARGKTLWLLAYSACCMVAIWQLEECKVHMDEYKCDYNIPILPLIKLYDR